MFNSGTFSSKSSNGHIAGKYTRNDDNPEMRLSDRHSQGRCDDGYFRGFSRETKQTGVGSEWVGER